METTENKRKVGLRAGVIASVVSAVVMLGSGMSFAADPTLPTDPSGGAYSSAWTTFQTWAVTIGVPALFGLTVLGIGIRMLLKFTKRAGRAI